MTNEKTCEIKSIILNQLNGINLALNKTHTVALNSQLVNQLMVCCRLHLALCTQAKHYVTDRKVSFLHKVVSFLILVFSNDFSF